MTIDALLEDEFEFDAIATHRTSRARLPTGACTRLAAAIVAITMISTWVWSPPDWLQPTILGMLWASLFLMGAAAGNVRRGSGAFAVVASVYVWISQVALEKLTSLVAAECSLLAVLLFAAGWLTVQFDFSAQTVSTVDDRLKRYQQWTLWDLALLTTLCAFVCYAMPRIESPPMLLTQVMFVLTAGCLCSWVAYRWVFDDCWSVSKLLALVAGAGLGAWLIGRQTPAELSMLHLLAWMLTGPLSVISAQSFTVLALLTTVRVDQGSLLVKQPKTQTNELESPELSDLTHDSLAELSSEGLGTAFSGLRIFSN